MSFRSIRCDDKREMEKERYVNGTRKEMERSEMDYTRQGIMSAERKKRKVDGKRK